MAKAELRSKLWNQALHRPKPFEHQSPSRLLSALDADKMHLVMLGRGRNSIKFLSKESTPTSPIGCASCLAIGYPDDPPQLSVRDKVRTCAEYARRETRFSRDTPGSLGTGDCLPDEQEIFAVASAYGEDDSVVDRKRSIKMRERYRRTSRSTGRLFGLGQ